MTTPLISDATLAKIVRAMYSADTDAAAEADVFDSIDRDVILEAVVNDKHAEALENARGCLAHRTDGASVIAALEEANEEAARNADSSTEHTAKADALTVAIRVATQGVATVDRIPDGFRMTAVDPYPPRNGCQLPRCSGCGGCSRGCGRRGSCGCPCGPCPTCNTNPATP